MSGFHRQVQPAAFDRATVTAIVTRLVAEETPDPFLIDNDCLNPAGHHFIASCGDVACVHCAKVAWS